MVFKGLMRIFQMCFSVRTFGHFIYISLKAAWLCLLRLYIEDAIEKFKKRTPLLAKLKLVRQPLYKCPPPSCELYWVESLVRKLRAPASNLVPPPPVVSQKNEFGIVTFSKRFCFESVSCVLNYTAFYKGTITQNHL
jgi:hypothetical protein